MKEYIKPPYFSTNFSAEGKNAKRRFENILNTKAKRAGAAVIALLVIAAALTGAIAVIRKPSAPPEKTTLIQRLYDAKHDYVGDMSKNGEIANVLGISAELGEYETQLYTSKEPYGWEFKFTEIAKDEAELDYKMNQYAPILMALIGNLEYVQWSNPGREAVVCDAYEASLRVGRNIREFGQSPEALAELLNLVGYGAEYGKDLFDTVDVEEFAENALIIKGEQTENIGVLNEFFNNSVLGNHAVLDVLTYTKEGDPILTRIVSDASGFRGAEYDGYDRFTDAENPYYSFGPYKHLKIFKQYGCTEFYLVNDPNLTIKEINEYLLSSAIWDNPPEFRFLFYFEGENSYEEAIY